MKAIIVEDSKLARTELKHLLKSVETVEVIAEAENVGSDEMRFLSRKNNKIHLR